MLVFDHFCHGLQRRRFRCKDQDRHIYGADADDQQAYGVDSTTLVDAKLSIQNTGADELGSWSGLIIIDFFRQHFRLLELRLEVVEHFLVTGEEGSGIGLQSDSKQFSKDLRCN